MSDQARRYRKPILQRLLDKTADQGFIFWRSAPIAAHQVLAGVRRWPDMVDVVSLEWREQVINATAYRAPISLDGNPFHPPFVTWLYEEKPIWVLRAVLTRPAPGTVGDFTEIQKPPQVCAILRDALMQKHDSSSESPASAYV